MKNEGYGTRNELILACASVARSPDASASEKDEARQLILLLIGAADEFTDRTGARFVRMEEAIREKSVQLGKNHPEVIRMRVDLAHQNFIEYLLEGAALH
ncbi:hypothetical protein [Burkholderia sp. WSM2230]|uniref:hypothetical protein n=1 Tax=Burkholderia sp. WSM2230 TaxID=944435 RepID=UPI000684D071|nr:hypothetical protein [Burkholderia sp. WSM2230]